MNIPAFRWARDAEVTAHIHSVAPVLISKSENGEILDNPWDVSFMRMFDMANDSDKFIDHEMISDRIVSRNGAKAILADGTEVYPLYEGKMIWHYDHRYGTYEGQSEKQANKGVLPRVDEAGHTNPDYQIQPRYWLSKSIVDISVQGKLKRDWFIGWRDLGPTERTLICCVIPLTAAGHKIPIMQLEVSAELISAFLAILSSLIIDFDARQNGNGMSYFIIEQLAIMHPMELASKQIWSGCSTIPWIADRVLELTYTNHELEAFAFDLGKRHPPFNWDSSRRQFLQAELDAAIMHLYELSREQAEWILESFTVLRKYEERDHGEFRTKRLVLEIFDEMQLAKDNGAAYKTRLDPPPGDPSLTHSSIPVQN